MSSQGAWKTVEIWNRKLHFYLGLYMLLFLWLFAVSGFILNHSTWRPFQFYLDQREKTFEHSIRVPPEGEPLTRARALMAQLGIVGEIEWPNASPSPNGFEFRVLKPGQIFDVKADFENARVAVHQVDRNAWAVIYNLHTFTGVRINNPSMQRDWFLTKIWSFAIDALALGLLFMVGSSYNMWWGLKQKRRLGIVVLALGIIACGFFALGLAWI